MDIEEQYDKIYRFCRYRMPSREVAEDLTQETFLRFLGSSYQEQGQGIRYLYTIARNLCIEESRKQREKMMPFVSGIAVFESFRSKMYGLALTGAILTVPYLLSSVGSMELERTAFGRKSSLGCLGVSAMVSAFMVVLQNERNILAESYRSIWYLAAFILIIMECIEKKKLHWEEYAWS